MFAGADGRSKAITLAVTCLGFFMVLLDVSIVTVALPTIQSSLHASLSGLQWVVDAYTLPFAVLLLTAGTLGDRFGRRRLFLFGLVMFLVGSTVCGLAPDLGWLIFGRVLQGAGSAALTPGSLSLLASAFTDPRERVQALGLWAGIAGIAVAAGSVVGGLLIQLADWPAIFLVNLPIGAVALVLGARTLRESRNPAARRLDVPGQVLAIAGLSALTFALIEGNGRGWDSPLILGLLAAAVALLVAFIVMEARSQEPMLPLSLFRKAIVAGANASVLIVTFSTIGIVFFSAQYFQAIQGFDALQAGLRSLPLMLGLFVGAPFAGRIAARFGFRPPILSGAQVGGAGMLLLFDLTPTTPYSELWWKLAFIGLGFGVIRSPLTSSIMTSTPPERAGLASSLVNTSGQLGTVFGVAVLGALVERSFVGNLTDRLAGAGIPADQSAALATTLAHAGSQAAHAQSAGPAIDPAALQALTAGAFTDALHLAYIVAGIGMLVVAALAAMVIGPSRVQVQPRAPAAIVEAPEEAA
jgi:DHA2 family methylenomycin A resistance protein-like MFS transporter